MDDFTSSVELFDRHGIDYDVHVFVGESAEENGFLEKLTHSFFGFTGLRIDLGHKLLFFVEGAIDLGTDSLPAYFLLILLLLDSLLELAVGLLLILFAGFGVTMRFALVALI